MQNAKDYGLSAEGVSFDLQKVVERSRGVSKQLNTGVGFLMKKNKVTVIKGEAVLEGKGSITVSGDDAGTYKAKHIILATGARPRVLPGLEPDQKTDLDLFQRSQAGHHAEKPVGCWLRRDWYRICQLLQHHGC